MDTIFMNSENSILRNLPDKTDLKEIDKCVALSILAYNIHRKYKKSYKNSKLEISGPYVE